MRAILSVQFCGGILKRFRKALPVCLVLLTNSLFAVASNCVPAGAISWWKAEGNALDSIGTNNGLLVGGLTFRPGRVARTFAFDGYQGTSVDLGDVPALRSANFGTIECWIRR